MAEPPDPLFHELFAIQQRVALLVDKLGTAVSELRETIDHLKDDKEIDERHPS